VWWRRSRRGWAENGEEGTDAGGWVEVRRENPRNEGREAGFLILREGMGVLLEGLQCHLLPHFEDGGRDEGIAGDSLIAAFGLWGTSGARRWMMGSRRPRREQEAI
jgi:hypothetical protein